MLTNLPERISIAPQVCFGKPVFKGTRIWVELILSLMADGSSAEEILHDYPQISGEDLLASLAYGASLAAGHFVDVA